MAQITPGVGCGYAAVMSDVTLLHNPNCSTSRHAKQVAAEAGVDVEIVQYLKTPLDEAALRDVLGKLEDPAGDLVRRDAFFKEQGLSEADVQTADQIVALLVEHPRLMQRPVLIRGDRAIIGRPKERVGEFLAC